MSAPAAREIIRFVKDMKDLVEWAPPFLGP